MQTFDLWVYRTPYNKLNIHCNGVYGDKQSADRFCKNFERLPESVQQDLLRTMTKYRVFSKRHEGIHKESAPICLTIIITSSTENKQNKNIRNGISTWGDIKPVVHYSESAPKNN